jgi:hypothetical protein
VRDGGLADADPIGDLMDAELAAGERIDDADAGGVAEEAKGVGEGLDRVGIPEERRDRTMHI